MKKYISILAVLLLLFSLFSLCSITVMADEAGETTSEQTETSSGLTASDFELSEDDDRDIGASIIETQNREVNQYILAIKVALVGNGGIYEYLSASAISSVLFRLFFPLGLLIFFISWCIGLGRKAIDGSLYDEGAGGGKKTIIQSFVRFFIGVVIISIGERILFLIDAIVQVFTFQTLSADYTSLQNFNDALGASSSTIQRSNTPIIGYFINLVNSFIADAQTNFTIFLLKICLFVILIVLGIRIIKLAIYRGLSPVFFGMIGSDETRTYTRNFILQYCMISAQLIVISALITAMQTAVASMYNAYASGQIQFTLYITGGVIVLVFTIMIFKSDKLFDKVLR